MTDPTLIPADVVRSVPEGEVVYGMQLPIQSQSTLYVADWEKDAGPTELARIARVAYEAGFFYIGVCDHTAIPRRLADAMGTIWYDTTATLGWLAAVTTQTHLLSHVFIRPSAPRSGPPRSCPRSTASRADASSSASVPDTCPRSTSCSPVASTSVAATPTRRSPRSPGASPTSFPSCPAPASRPRHGSGAMPPIRQPRPPIWIGGSSPVAIRRTAAFGDGWLPQGTRRPDLPGQIARLRELRAELRDGAPIDIGTIVEPIHLTSGGSGRDLPGLGHLRRWRRGGRLAARARRDGREPPAGALHGAECRGNSASKRRVSASRSVPC